MQIAKSSLTVLVVTFGIVAALATLGSQSALAVKNLTGEWSCDCSGGKGTCKVITDSSGMRCFKGEGSTCSGTCEFTSGTTGVHGGAVIQKEQLAPTLQPKVQPKVVPKGTIQRQ